MKYMQNKLPSGSHGTIKKIMSFILIGCLLSTVFVLPTTLNVKGKTTPNISVEKYVSSNGYNYFKDIEVQTGEGVIFKLVVDNTGDTTLDLFVKDTLPDGLSYIQGSSIVNGYSQEPYIIVGNNLYWQFPNTVPQETVIITFHATVDDCGIHTNKVNVTGSYNNGEIYGEDTATVTADCWPVIQVDKKAWNGSAWVDTINATVGETIRFNITISNIGSGPYVLYDITVNDTLPDFLTYADDATLNGEPREPDSTDNRNIIWRISWWEARVHPGESLFIEFDTLVTGCGNDVNLVNVTSQYCDPDILYVYGEDTVPVNVTCLFPDIDLVKTADVTQACIGETITYTYRVTNTGDVTLTNVNVNDNMLGSIVLNTTTLNPGEYAVGTAHYTVNEDDLPGPIINHATASGTPPVGEDVTDTDYTSVEVCYHPGIDLIKEADVDEACIGETITYTYTVTNTGDVTLNNVNVEDDLLGSITLNKTTLAPGEWATGTATHVVDENDLPGPIVNHATATGTPPVDGDVTDTDDASVDVCYEVGLTVEKYVKWDCTPPFKDMVEAHVGERVTFKIYVNNTGNTPLNITVKDALPEGLNYRHGTANHSEVFEQSQNILYWNFTSVQPQTSIEITFVADIEECGNLVNLVNVTGEYETTHVYAEDTATVFALCPTVKIVKDVDKPLIHEGDQVTYTYTITNEGNCNLTNVTVTDDQDLTPVFISGDTNGNGWLNLDETWIYQVTTALYSNVTNTGNTTAEDELKKMVYDEDNATVHVIHPNIDVTKTANVTQAHAGDVVNYTIVVTNTGDDTLYNVYVNDTTLGISYYIDSLAAGESKTYYVEHTLASEPDPFENCVEAEGYDALGERYSDSDCSSVDVISSNIEVTKTANVTQAHAGDDVSYAITVKNTGDDTLYNVYVNDTTLGISYHISTLPPGGSKTYYVEYSLPSSPDPFVNTVTAEGYDALGTRYSDSDSYSIDLISAALTVKKTGNITQAHAGDAVNYTIWVNNTGDDTLYNVWVNDTALGVNKYIGELTNGSSHKFYVKHVLAATPDPLVNTVNAEGYDVLGKRYVDSSSFTVDIISSGLTVEKTPDITEGHAGDVVNYTIAVTNTGDDTLYNVYVNDTTLDVSYYVGSLAAGESKTYYVEHTLASEPDPFENCVEAEGYDELGEKYSDSDCATVDIIEEPGVTVEKYVNNKGSQAYSKETSAEKGDIVSFKIVVNNTGDTPLNITVKDELPEELRYNNNAYPREPDTVTDNNVYWNFTNISSGGNITIIFDALALDCGDLVNLVNVTGTYRNLKVYDDDTATVDVPCEPNISVDKKAWNGSKWVDKLYLNEFGVKVGFNITVKNTGTVELKNITVIDTPSDCCLRDPTDFKPNYTKLEDNNIYWMINKTLKPGEKIYLEFSAFVYCNVTNIVEAYANSSYGNVNDSDELPISREVSRLSYAPLSHDFGFMTPGETANTTFEIWNSGNGTLRYTISENCPWVNVTPTIGESTGEHDNITVSINTTNLQVNTTHVCNLTISSNGGSGVFTITVTVVSGPHLSYTPTSHDFGQLYESEGAYTTFEIWNSGNGLLSYSFSENCSWVDIAPLSGTSTGEHDMVTVALNTTGLTPGNHTCNITIASNGGNGLFTVHVTVVARPEAPNITLLRPKENMLYINNKEITTFSTTLILGPITLHANATDTDGYIEKVEFYVDNTLEFNDTMRPYAWVWNEKVVGRHTITVKAYDNDGFTSQKSLTVTILNLGFGSVNKYGILQGKVTEEGRILDIGLPNVNVTVSNGNHTKTGNTPFVNKGVYSLTLQEGVYDVTFEAKDYHTYVAKNVEVVQGATTTLNVQLKYICEGCD